MTLVLLILGAVFVGLLLVAAIVVVVAVVLARRRKAKAMESGGGGVPATPPAAPRRCIKCGTPVPADGPLGLCPKCMLAHGLDSQRPTEDSPSALHGSPARGGFTPPAPADLAARFPQLEILELLGQGGMGAVYKARQPGLDRLVALKILPPGMGADPAFAERFTREARSLARLNHPNVVAVYDFGQAGDLYYFLMEYIDGVNLREMQRVQRLDPKQALDIVIKVCEALQYAHDEGIVHRDIKPENLLVDKKGRVKIADFGLAKLLGRTPADFTLTSAGQMLGTPAYMAPEQVERPGIVDQRADIYSLGVVFYEMLTGELPLGRFQAPSQMVHVDVRLDEVVLKALEKQPERRYQQASEVRTDVEQISRGPQAPQATAQAGPAAGFGGALPPHAMRMMLGLSIGMVACALLMTLGVATLAYAWATGTLWQNFGAWMGSFVGCFVGGAGGVIGSWNSYRRLEGRGDLLEQGRRTRLDHIVLVYGVVGAMAFLAAASFGVRLGEAVTQFLYLLGALMAIQAVGFLSYRSAVRRHRGTPLPPPRPQV